jgi:hypothetical protein
VLSSPGAVKNDGTDKTLVVLDGTIPMFHNQKKYNCPVRFWLVLDYPMSPPICYVSPTRDMGIKPRHVHVDNAGFIYHQYLTQWNVRSTLKDLCSTLTTVFSKDPPVYAKPQGGQATHPPHQQSTPQPQPVQQPPQQQPQQQPPSHPPQQAAARASKPAPASGSSHVLQPPQHLPSQASGHPGPSSLASLPSNLLGGDTQRQPPAVADAELEAALALSAQLAAADKHSTVEQESKESLIFFVMSKINVKRSSCHFPSCIQLASLILPSVPFAPPPPPTPPTARAVPLLHDACMPSWANLLDKISIQSDRG